MWNRCRHTSFPRILPPLRQTRACFAPACHIAEEDLEQFTLGMIEDEDSFTWLLRHLNACSVCARRLHSVREYVRVMKTALVSWEIRDRSSPSSPGGQSN